MTLTKKTVMLLLLFACYAPQTTAMVEVIQPQVEKIAHAVAFAKNKAQDAFTTVQREAREISEDIKSAFYDLQDKFSKEIHQLESLKNKASSILFGQHPDITIAITENADFCVVEVLGIEKQQNDVFNATISYDKDERPIQAKISSATQTITVKYSAQQSVMQVNAYVQKEQKPENNAGNAVIKQSVVTLNRNFAKSLKNTLQFDLLAIEYSAAQQKMTISIPIVKEEVRTKSVEISVTK